MIRGFFKNDSFENLPKRGIVIIRGGGYEKLIP
jgi:hypothetical protein